MISKLFEEFDARNIAVVAIGADSGNAAMVNQQQVIIPLSLVTNFRRWAKDIEELQSVKVNIPLVSDLDCAVLRKVWVEPSLELNMHLPIILSYVCYYLYLVWLCPPCSSSWAHTSDINWSILN